MTNDRDFSKLGELVTMALTRADRRSSMTIEEMRIFDQDCARYDYDVKEAKSALLKMTSRMPSPGVEQDPEMRAAGYWEILKDELSPDSITHVCKKAMAGRIGNPDWLPTAGRLIQFAKASENYIQRGPVKTDPRREPARPSCLAPPEHRRLGREYGDEQFKADERARIGRQWRVFADEMRVRSAVIAASEKPVYSKLEISRTNAGEREKQRI